MCVCVGKKFNNTIDYMHLSSAKAYFHTTEMVFYDFLLGPLMHVRLKFIQKLSFLEKETLKYRLYYEHKTPNEKRNLKTFLEPNKRFVIILTCTNYQLQ